MNYKCVYETSKKKKITLTFWSLNESTAKAKIKKAGGKILSITEVLK